MKVWRSNRQIYDPGAVEMHKKSDRLWQLLYSQNRLWKDSCPRADKIFLQDRIYIKEDKTNNWYFRNNNKTKDNRENETAIILLPVNRLSLSFDKIDNRKRTNSWCLALFEREVHYLVTFIWINREIENEKPSKWKTINATFPGEAEVL